MSRFCSAARCPQSLAPNSRFLFAPVRACPAGREVYWATSLKASLSADEQVIVLYKDYVPRPLASLPARGRSASGEGKHLGLSGYRNSSRSSCPPLARARPSQGEGEGLPVGSCVRFCYPLVADARGNRTLAHPRLTWISLLNTEH